MAAQKIITQQVDLSLQDGRDRLEWPNVLAIKGDHHAHLWRVVITDNGSPVDLTGYTAYCYVINDGKTTMLEADRNGNVVSASFPSPCYAAAGEMKCLMSLHNSGQTPTVAMLRLRVLDSITDVLIDPEDLIPNVADLMEIVTVLSGVAAAEGLRTAAEDARASAEGIRNAAETARISAEQARATAEVLRASAEALRVSAETQRSASEAARIAAETARVSAEGGRASAENTRSAAEAVRNAAESQRQSNTATAVTMADSAASAANTAAGAANTAAGNAADAAIAANTAAGTANAAAAKIDGMTVETSVVPFGTTPQATITEVSGHKHVAIQTQRGPQGPGYTIKGAAYATLAALQAAVTNPADGEQYNVGSTAPYHVYRWTGSVWEDQGELQGPKGDKGVTFTPTVSPQGVVSFSNDGGQENPAPVNLANAAAAVVPAVRFDVDQSDSYDAAAKARARANMAAASTALYTAVLPIAGWTGSGPYTQAVAVAGLLADDTPMADVLLSDAAATAVLQLAGYGLIGRIDAGSGTISVTCYEEKPEVELTLLLKVVR